MKRCTKCSIEKEDNDFYKDRGSKDGLDSWCRSCCAVYNAEYRERNGKRYDAGDVKIASSKLCSKCNLEKPASEFNKNKSSKDGLHIWCRKCSREYEKARQDKLQVRRSAGEFIITETKHCSRCGMEKPLSEFGKFRQNRDGRTAECKACLSIRDKEYPKKNQMRYERGEVVVPSIKHCSSCGIEKSSSEFTKDRGNKDGLANWCKACWKDFHKARPNYHNDFRARKKYEQWSLRTTHSHRVPHLRDQITRVAELTTRCPICRCELVYCTPGKDRSHVATLDRIDNGKTGNHSKVDDFWIICFDCNSTKQDRSMSEFVEYCRMVINKFDGGVVP